MRKSQVNSPGESGKNAWYKKANAIRKRKRIPYWQIAEAMGVAVSTVGHWFIGTNDIGVQDLFRLAKVLGTTAAELAADDAAYIVSHPDARLWMDIWNEKTAEERLALLSAFGKTPGAKQEQQN